VDQARYAELFRTEAREHLAELDAALLSYEQQHDPAQVATLFRSMHTIKGMAAAMGYRAVEQVSHALESLLDGVRRGSISGDARLLALLFDGTDALRSSIDEAVEGRGEDVPDSLIPLLQRVRSLADDHASPSSAPISSVSSSPRSAPLAVNTPREATSAAEPSGRRDTTPPIAAASADSRVVVDVRLTDDCPLKGVRAMLVLARLTDHGAVQQCEPPQSGWNSDHFAGTFAVTLVTSASESALEAAARSAGDVARVSVRRAPLVRREASAEALRTVRVDRKRLDTLLDLVGELVITRDRLLRVAEASDHSSTRELTRAAHDTARLISALQDEVLQARMVPVGHVFDRFPRLVRDIARDLGKDVQFVMEGREIELDRSLLDALSDPLLHLLRNALDHGIEDADTRRNAGKASAGTLTLRAVRDRAAVVIQVEDDGRGINRQAILRRAQQQGVVPDSTTALDDDALLQVLAHAGFSTARSVTAISGRGVGVDVVATRVRSLGGSLGLETIEGQGTAFTLRLPVTLAITRALLVQVAEETYALPAAHVVEALEYAAGTSVTPAAEFLILRDESIPLLHVRERFGLPRREHDCHVAVVEVSGRRTALVVDTLVAQQDVVVKPIDLVHGSAPWFSGATVLGDGTPALIVDLGSLT